jgi:hypothetical protein
MMDGFMIEIDDSNVFQFVVYSTSNTDENGYSDIFETATLAAGVTYY